MHRHMSAKEGKMNYYTKLKDEEKIVILIHKGFTKEQFEKGGSLRNDIGLLGQKDIENGEVHSSEESFTIKVKGRGLLSEEPRGKARRCYNGEKVIFLSGAECIIVPTICSKVRRTLIRWGII